PTAATLHYPLALHDALPISGAQAMIDMIGDRTKRIYLGHLSKGNNMKSIAHQTCVSKMVQADLGVHDQFEVYDTNPDKPTSLYTDRKSTRLNSSHVSISYTV